MIFEVDIGIASTRGARAVNEDFAGVERGDRNDNGLIAAIADGVSTGGRGGEAAQSSVTALLSDFFATPATWDTTVALDRLIAAQNNWLLARNRSLDIRSAGAGEGLGESPAAALTTLTTLVLRGHGWSVAHVGDTRAWRISAGEIHLLTHDHVLPHLDLRSGLTRALGLDDVVRVDYLQGEARVGDAFLLTSDGTHKALLPARLAELAGEGSAQEACETLVAAAVAAGSNDNATAVLVRVKGLDPARLDDEAARIRQLPPLKRLRVGDAIDGFRITGDLADTGVHRLYQARESASGDLVVLKTLHESRGADAEERTMLAHEAWLGARVTEREARGFVRVRESLEATALYTVFDWHPGQTLEQMLARGRQFSIAEIVAGTTVIARALSRLHRQRVIHRDIKPANLHLGEDGQWRLIDLGAALSGRESAAARSLHAGTPSYMNPELWDGAPADAAGDLYALGVTLYRWISGRLPYGEVEPYQTGRYRRDPLSTSRHRPEVPVWLDHLVLKAVALDPKLRFETAEEMLLALERGAARPVSVPPQTPLATRDPAMLWQIGFWISVMVNLLLIYWLTFLPR